MGEGALVYNGTDNSFLDTSLDSSTQYFYQFWSYCANLGSDITGPFTKNEQDKKPGLIMTFETLFCIDKVGAKMSLRFFLRAMPKE